jgi:DNA polymerase III alpha subunit
MVESVRELFTKDHRPFCSCMICDDVASLEVMVWPRNYEANSEIWKEGNFLLIQGKVKIKEDRIQITCDAVETYKPDTEPKASLLMFPATLQQPEQTRMKTGRMAATVTEMVVMVPVKRLMVSRNPVRSNYIK